MTCGRCAHIRHHCGLTGEQCDPDCPACSRWAVRAMDCDGQTGSGLLRLVVWAGAIVSSWAVLLFAGWVIGTGLEVLLR